MAARGLTFKFYTTPQPRARACPELADGTSRRSNPLSQTECDGYHLRATASRGNMVKLETQDFDDTNDARPFLAILVSGGAGYVGSHAARALRRSGYEVVLYDNLSTGFRRLAHGIELVEGDIADEARLRRVLARVDTVMHFAAHAYVGESVENPRKYFRNNVLGALSLLNSALDAGIRRFVFSSSCAVYGIPGQTSTKQVPITLPTMVPITEETPREPVNPYGASKLFFENALEAYGRAYGLRSVSLRYFNAAGADESGEIGELHDPETHLIPLALAASTGKGAGLQVPELQVYGSDYPTPDGTCVRDYIHVNDLADAHVRALQSLERGGDEKSGDSMAINLGTGRGYSVLEVIAAVESATGRPVRRTIKPRRWGDPPVLVADPATSQRLLGWTAKRNLGDIVSSAWIWMQKTARCQAA
jgi:UDP-glucose-4-epimerase GalE